MKRERVNLSLTSISQVCAPSSVTSDWVTATFNLVWGIFLSEAMWTIHARIIIFLCSIHSLLNPLECILCFWMTILVWVKLLRQFSIELGELGGLHFHHAMCSAFKNFSMKGWVFFYTKRNGKKEALWNKRDVTKLVMQSQKKCILI